MKNNQIKIKENLATKSKDNNNRNKMSHLINPKFVDKGICKKKFYI